jgi:outer membrane biosynthesis protein TonB
LLGLLGSPAAEPAPSTLDASAISRIMRANVASVRACYERGLQTDPNLAGRTVVHFTITPSGAVSNVTAAPTLAAPAVLRCMEAAVASLTFPADEAREPISINYPFVFDASP